MNISNYVKWIKAFNAVIEAPTTVIGGVKVIDLRECEVSSRMLNAAHEMSWPTMFSADYVGSTKLVRVNDANVEIIDNFADFADANNMSDVKCQMLFGEITAVVS